VAKALGDFLVLDALYASSGCAVAVADDDVLRAQRQIGEVEGVFVCPEGATTLAACHRLRAEGWLRPDDEVVLVNTGAGIKYLDTVERQVPVLEPGNFSAVSALASAP
jgi:threonine synthase